MSHARRTTFDVTHPGLTALGSPGDYTFAVAFSAAPASRLPRAHATSAAASPFADATRASGHRSAFAHQRIAASGPDRRITYPSVRHVEA